MTEETDRDSPDADPGTERFPIKDTVDARGLRCPLPLLRAKQGLSRLASGERIMILATDAGSVRDFHSFSRLSNTRLCHFSDADGVYTYILEKP